jgi:hypothetical protein
MMLSAMAEEFDNEQSPVQVLLRYIYWVKPA